VNPKATWSGSLKSYHPYLLSQKVSKNPIFFFAAFIEAYPKMQKAVLASLEL
jgi:hypothetical protein